MSDATMAHSGQTPGEHAHPGPRTYAKIAAVLCGITLVEFICYYLQSVRAVLVPLLIFLSGIKFALVAMFYMHLRFDHRVYTRLLLVGLIIGIGVVLSLLALFNLSHPI
jgi:cytochrome c oxidase subunit IV